MADEIISKLGFDVAQALDALQRLDSQLGTSATALQTHARQLNAWNSQAQAALVTMKSLATASGRLSKMSAAAPTMPAAQTEGSKLWLPSGTREQIDNANRSMATLGGTSATTGQKMVQAGRAGAQVINQTDAASKRLVMSFQMMGRIVFTQAIVRALSQVRNLLRESVGESIKFQRAISEVLLITMAPLEGSMRETTSTFRSLTDEAANMAKRFNVDLGQAVEGIYQTISNQFVEVSERTQIMEASMKLAKVGVIDLKDSVLLMTGVLNAYGMSSQNADRVAAQFFRTIQLGRVRGKELADTLGSVIPVAAQLGVSLEEVTASYVSLTIGGIEAHKAATGMRQAMLALLKPSENLKEILRELGYSNPEQIVQAEKFVGALKLISVESKNMGSEYVKSIRRIRAFTTASALTRDDAQAYEEAVAAMSKSASEHLDQLYAKFKEMPAEALTHEINKLKVTLTQELGSAIVQALSFVLQWVGGAHHLAAALQAVTVVVVLLGGAMVVLAMKALLASAALGPLGLVLMALSSFVAISVYRSAAEIASIRDVAEARRRAAEEQIQEIQKVNQVKRKDAEDARREENRLWEQGAASIRRSYFKAIDSLKFKNKELVDDTRETLAAMVKSQERVVAAYRSAAKASADAVQASRERQMASEAQYSDTIFKYANKNERAYQKAENYMRRAMFLARDAEEALRSAKTPEDISSALAVFQRAEAAAQEAENIAGGTKYTLLQDDAQRRILFVMRQKIEAEKELQMIQAEEAQRLAEKAASEQQRLSQMKVLMKGILEDLQAFDKAGAKDPKALGEQQKRLETSVDDFRKLWLGGEQIDVADMMAFDKLQQRVQTALEGGVTDVQVQNLTALPETFADFRFQIERGVGTIRVMLDTVLPQLPPRLQEMVEGATAEETMSILSSELGNTNDVLRQYAEMSDAASVANKQISGHQKDALASLDEWVENGLRPENFDITKMTVWSEPVVKDVAEAFIRAASDFTSAPVGTIAESDFAALKTAYDNYIEQIKPPVGVQETLEQFMQDAAKAASQANAKAKLLRGLRGVDGGIGLEQRAVEAGELRSLLQEALQKAQDAQDALRNAGGAVRQVQEQADGARAQVTAVSQISMTGLTTQTSAAANAMWDLAYASMSVKTPGAGELSAHGGRVGRYLAAGGPAGTDVVPAWLSRGEFVMNAQATGQFASQLVAMNAGVQPIFRSEGGSVTNIGDINVTVKDGATGRQTARSIAAELRRELRRGTTTI